MIVLDNDYTSHQCVDTHILDHQTDTRLWPRQGLQLSCNFVLGTHTRDILKARSAKAAASILANTVSHDRYILLLLLLLLLLPLLLLFILLRQPLHAVWSRACGRGVESCIIVNDNDLNTQQCVDNLLLKHHAMARGRFDRCRAIMSRNQQNRANGRGNAYSVDAMLCSARKPLDIIQAASAKDAGSI